jgi:2,5-furandicarboxylate decarboxylase 1
MIDDLRSFLNLLEGKNDLVHIGRPTSTKFEIAAGIRKTSQIEGPALLFENVVGHSMPVAGGLYAVRRRAVYGLETTAEKIHGKIMEGLRNHIPPKIVKDGPCKEVILTGNDADFARLPICTHNAKDAGPFITIGLGFTRHPEYGNNVSISRMQIYDGKTMGCRSVPPQHLGVYFREAESKGVPLEVAFTIGNDPYVTLCSQISGSIYLDELNVAGGWMGRPVDVVKCETVDVYVPATSEIVLEGELIPGERRTEGPFGEFPGYYQAVTQQAVFKLKAITHRRNPIYVTALTGPPTTDNHVMKEVILEAILYDRVRQICPTVRDVCVTKGGVNLHVVVSMKPTFVSQARDVMLASFSTERIRPKLVVVVDEDIDPRDPVMVEWAMATRFQADQDLVVLPRQVGAPLDPSTPGVRLGAIMGIDATRPYGREFPEVAVVPGADDFVIPGWTDGRR